jgi:hypothetical protein
MQDYLLEIIFVIALVLVWLWWRWTRYAPPSYVRADFLTATERDFYEVLIEAVEELDFHLIAKVRLADLIVPNPELAPDDRLRAFNRVRSKHVDFVVCRDMEPLLVIELDDPSHNRPDRIERDEFVDEALAQCDLPILHVPTAPKYGAAELKKAIADYVEN